LRIACICHGKGQRPALGQGNARGVRKREKLGDREKERGKQREREREREREGRRQS
jgi:hypothetical protein